MRRIDLTGQRFGRWTVLRYAYTTRQSCWEVQCDCGTISIRGIAVLRNGSSRSCGCWRKELWSQAVTKHGGTYTPEFRIWQHMKDRCHNPNNTGYQNYGARGISVDERWRHNFENFLADLGRRPSAKHSLDRIDNDGNYEPGNCRWATHKEQKRNRRNSRIVTIDGLTACLSEVCERLGLDRGRVYSLMCRGYTAQEAADRLND